jgi:uncharacterized protein YmfQ (DUF2313 family)
MPVTIAEKSLASCYPTGPEWEGVENGVMREQIAGCAVQLERDRQAAIKILSDFMPYSTTLVDEWEKTFALPQNADMTLTQRAARLVATWKHISPSSFDGINEIYQLSGFNVTARPLKPTEDPRILAANLNKYWQYVDHCGDLNAHCGDLTAQCGDYEELPLIPIPRIFADGRHGTVEKNFTDHCGDLTARCGDLTAQCGDYSGYNINDPAVIIPDDIWTWGLIYIIDDGSGGFANIPSYLKTAYEFLTLKIKPLFMWAISRINYT